MCQVYGCGYGNPHHRKSSLPEYLLLRAMASCHCLHFFFLGQYTHLLPLPAVFFVICSRIVFARGSSPFSFAIVALVRRLRTIRAIQIFHHHQSLCCQDLFLAALLSVFPALRLLQDTCFFLIFQISQISQTFRKAFAELSSFSDPVTSLR